MNFRRKENNHHYKNRFPSRMIRKATILLIFCLSAVYSYSNDGVFYAEGNQLIPITETDISVKKEVLTINRVGDHLEVTVYYEFFNPVGEKELLVGFEAKSPYNSMADAFKMLPKHPHIRHFKVVMNGEPLTYEIANVKSGRYDKHDNYILPPYYANGRFLHWSPQQIEDTLTAWGDPPGLPIDYVYHFKAQFRPGLNIIQHTYDFDLSFSVGEEFYFPYVLTAANRWANHQIDDFILNINMGDHESFMITPNFFKTADEWVFTGQGRISMDSIWTWDDNKHIACPKFHVQKGGLSFHKTNFHPEGELYITKRSTYYYSEETSDNTNLSFLTKYYRPFAQVLSRLCGLYSSAFTIDSSDYNYNYDSVTTPEQRRILKNLPFAYRGYIFKNKALQDYFNSTEWYLPNPEYKGEMDDFSEEERKWVEFWSK